MHETNEAFFGYFWRRVIWLLVAWLLSWWLDSSPGRVLLFFSTGSVWLFPGSPLTLPASSAANTALCCGTPFCTCQFAPLKARVCHVSAAISFSRRLSQDRAFCLPSTLKTTLKNPRHCTVGGGGGVGICFSPLILSESRVQARGEPLAWRSRWIALGCFSPQAKAAALAKVKFWSLAEDVQKSIVRKKKKNPENILSHTQIFGVLELTEFRRTKIYSFGWGALATSPDANRIFHFPSATLMQPVI